MVRRRSDNGAALWQKKLYKANGGVYMNKKDLLAMPRLLATPTMLRIAKENPPKKEIIDQWGWKREQVSCKYGIYLRCMIQNGILMVAFFLPGVLCLGGREPIYELYVDKANDKFLTYDTVNQKWRTAKLDLIEWPESYAYNTEKWISGADSKRILEYLDYVEMNNAYSGLLRFQQSIRDKERLARYARETAPWDEDMKQIRPLPKDWSHWIDKVGIPEQFIYYEYKRGAIDTGYCSYCEKDVPIHNPRHNKPGRCPCCRHEIRYKALGRVGFLSTEDYYAYLLQRADCGFVIRMFTVWRRQARGEHKAPRIVWREIRRAFFTAQGVPVSAYDWGVYKQTTPRWIKGGLCCRNLYSPPNGRVYGKTIPDLAKRGLSRTGLLEHIRNNVTIEPEYYLAVLKAVPQLEQLVKADLPILVQECLHDAYHYESFFEGRTGSLKHMLGIGAQQLKRLREVGAGLKYLQWMRLEHEYGRKISDETIKWFISESIDIGDVTFILNRMTVEQVFNYVQTQMRKSHMNSRAVLQTWKDYLSMAARLGYNVNDEIVYRTAKLRKRHDDLVERCRHEDHQLQIRELQKKFPHVEKICVSQLQKYSYTGDTYTVIAPKGVADIIAEGNALHHCIASSDRYLERMERHESYILFLRKSEKPEQPYYTMEVEPNGTVRQIRTEYDRQNKDIEEAREFLRGWQKALAENLTATDRRRAKKSSILRMEEFAELRKDQVKVHTGALAGHLLVDVLAADLLEAA